MEEVVPCKSNDGIFSPALVVHHFVLLVWEEGEERRGGEKEGRGGGRGEWGGR